MSHDVIDILVTYAIDHWINYLVGDITCVCEASDATKLGKLLCANASAVCSIAIPRLAMPSCQVRVGERASNYEFKRAECFREFIREYVEEYDYQACETDDYDQSAACRIINAI